MNTIGQPFGNEKAKLITLQNKNNVKVTITNFGARIVSYKIPLSNGYRDITLHYNCDESYLLMDKYVGATIAPVAGRISNGSTLINDKLYYFNQNENTTTLHGGENSSEVQYYKIEVVTNTQVVLSYLFEDGFNGFPGNIEFYVTYTLTQENELIVNYKAKSQKDTIFNPTNHVYFNLSGNFKEKIDNHFFKIDADFYVPLNDQNLPLGHLEKVDNTPFDFRKGEKIKQGFSTTHPQNQLVNGYDHAFLLNGSVHVISPDNRVELLMRTDAPSVVIYTYNGKVPKHHKTVTHGVFTLETQRLPNACNIEQFGTILLKKDTIFETTTTYQVKFK